MCEVPGKSNILKQKKKSSEGREVNKPGDIELAEKQIEDSSEGISAKQRLGCPFQLSDEVKCTFTRLCRIQGEKAGVSSLFMEIQL